MGARRPVVVYTAFGSIECGLPVHATVRTLDFLNLPERFVPLVADRQSVACWGFEGGRLGVRKESILFVAELDQGPDPGEPRVEAAHFTREPIALRVGDCDVKGFVHVRGIHDPLAVLCRYRGEFLALTSASIVGPDLQMTSHFVAVNGRHVVGVQAQPRSFTAAGGRAIERVIDGSTAGVRRVR